MSRSFASISSPERRAPLILTLIALTALTGCSMPNFEGPQVQSPPRGFLLVPDSYGPRRMFPEHDVTFHAAWVESIQDFSTIFINAHPGALTLDDVLEAQDSARRYPNDPDATFGAVEPLTIDGRTGWGWAERVETPGRGLVSVAYRAVVPYDTVSYAIEFDSGEPGLKRAAPDTLRAIVSTFAIGETTWNTPLIAIMLGALVLAAHTLHRRRAERTARLQSINLVSVKKNENEGGEDRRPQSEIDTQELPAIPAGAASSQEGGSA